jgi:DHA2 family multidrug resistance protein
MRTMAGSFATAISVWIWNRRTDFHHAVLTEHVRAGSDAWLQYQSQLSAHGVAGTGASAYVNAVIEGQASTLAANDVFNLMAVIFVVLIPLVWFAKPPFGARAPVSDH